MLLRASQRAPIDVVCEAVWLSAAVGEKPIDRAGIAGPTWDENVAARLEVMGCPNALVHHHVRLEHGRGIGEWLHDGILKGCSYVGADTGNAGAPGVRAAVRVARATGMLL